MFEKFMSIDGGIEILTKDGFKKQSEVREAILETIPCECPQCKAINDLDAKVCSKCGYIFKEEKKEGI